MAGAGTGALAHLRAKACACALLEPEQARTEPVLVGEFKERFLRCGFAAEQAIQVVESALGHLRTRDDLRRAFVIALPADAGERGVAPQPAVVDRHQVFHQLRLAQQRTEFASGLVPLDARRLLRDLHLARAAVVGGEVRQHTGAQIDALADVERGVALIEEEIDARGIRDGIEHICANARGQRGQSGQRGDVFGKHCFAERACHLENKLAGGLRIAHGAVARTAAKLVTGDKGVEVVARLLGVEPPGKLDRAEHRAPERKPRTLEGIAQETVVEAGVVGHEGNAFQAFADVLGQ